MTPSCLLQCLSRKLTEESLWETAANAILLAVRTWRVQMKEQVLQWGTRWVSAGKHWVIGLFPGLDKPCSTTDSFQRQLCCSLCSSDLLLSCTRAQKQRKTFAFWDENIATVKHQSACWAWEKQHRCSQVVFQRMEKEILQIINVHTSAEA